MFHFPGRILCLISAVALLVGCETASISESTEGENQTSATEQQVPATEQQTPIAAPETLILATKTSAAGTAEGYYLVDRADDWTGVLSYCDYATMQKVALCAQPNCQHNSDSCTAWLANSFNIPYPVICNDQLILIYNGSGIAEDGKAGLPQIEVADLDGQNRTTLCTFPADVILDENCVLGNQGIYLLGSGTQAEEGNAFPDKFLYKVHLDTGEIETIWRQSQDKPGSSFLAGTLEGDIVVKKILVDLSAESSRERTATQIHCLLRISTDGSRQEEILRWQQGEKLDAGWDDRILLLGSGTLSEYLPGVGETLLMESPVFSTDGCTLVYAQDDLLWFNSLYGGKTEGMGGSLYQVDTQSGQVDVLQPVDAQGNPLLVTPLDSCGNDLLVSIMKSSYLGAKAQYALVSPESLKNSSPDFRYFAE